MKPAMCEVRVRVRLAIEITSAGVPDQGTGCTKPLN